MAGKITYISKNYSEQAESIGWHATGDIDLQAGTQVKMHGKQDGVKFAKNTPVKLQSANLILKKFLVHFRRPSDYQGAYGFDWPREEYFYPMVTVTHDNNGTPINALKPLCKDVAKLKQEYLKEVKSPIIPYGIKYYPAWLSIFPHTTTQQFAHGSDMHKNGVDLDLQFDELETLLNDKTEIILETKNPFLKVTPQKFSISEVLGQQKRTRIIGSKTISYYKLSKKVNIKCQGGVLNAHEEIKVYAQLGKQKVEVGKLMVYKNSVIPKAEIVAVNVITSANKSLLRDDYEFLFKNQSFNQALIRAEIKVDTQFDLTALQHNSDVSSFLNNAPNWTSEQIKNTLVSLYDKYGKHKPQAGIINSNATKRTYLFYTELTAGNVLGSCSLDSNGGWGNSYVVYKSALNDKHTVIHEAGHSFSLPHVFQEGSSGKHIFYHGYTDNYMDYTWQAGTYTNGKLYSSGPNKYKDKMYSFYKWQWDIMRQDRSLIFNY